MTAQDISMDLLGVELDPVDIAWEQKDVQLYSVAVGAQPESELQFIYEGAEGGLQVLPTYGVVPGLAVAGGLMGKAKFNLMMLLHGEQAITLHKPLPVNFKGKLKGRISEVFDKGKAAVLGVTADAEDESGEKVFSIHLTMFIRGAGGFDGERGSSDPVNVVPDREPDHVVKDQTTLQQAAIYRLTGDINPIHIDPNFAKLGGFEKPFLHGLCTYGFVGRAALQALCGGDSSKFTHMEARFADRVELGDEIITKIWEMGNGEAIVQAETQKGNIVLSQAKVCYKS
jgi:acyl dehydratase